MSISLALNLFSFVPQLANLLVRANHNLVISCFLNCPKPSYLAGPPDTTQCHPSHNRPPASPGVTNINITKNTQNTLKSLASHPTPWKGNTLISSTAMGIRGGPSQHTPHCSSQELRCHSCSCLCSSDNHFDVHSGRRKPSLNTDKNDEVYWKHAAGFRGIMRQTSSPDIVAGEGYHLALPGFHCPLYCSSICETWASRL